MAQTVHPHVCGEHAPLPSPSPPDCGSSPRVWGTWRRGRPGNSPHRFIPTCVGNIAPEGAKRDKGTVHPHVCGEHETRRRPKGHEKRFIPTCVGNMAAPIAFKTYDYGSSPRVWGTSFLRLRVVQRQRFIPTCVGNMSSCVFGSYSANGSSPRVWGTSFDFCVGWEVWRFIPTCVGNMRRSLRGHSLIGGSSPRVWGT